MKKVSFYLLLLILISSCSSIKRVPENKLLLTKNTIIVDDGKNKDDELNDYLLLRPNSKTLGFPFPLYFYNLGNEKNSKTPSQWAKRNPKTYNFFKGLFSEKQSIGVANTFIGINKWFLTSGQAPVIIDPLKVRKTEKNLKTYLLNQGYFNAKVASKIDTLKKKKGAVRYIISKGVPLMIDSIYTSITSPVLDSIYAPEKEHSYLRPNTQFNDNNFRKEAQRIVKLFRNSGIFHFNENHLQFEIDTTDSLKKDRALITLKVKSEWRAQKNNQYVSLPFKVQKIGAVHIYTDYTYNEKDSPYLDTITYQGMKFIAHEKVRYNPKYLSQSIFLKPNVVYNDSIQSLTRQHLKSLNNFKSVVLKFSQIPGKDDELKMDVLLTPIEKYTIGAETELTHSNIRNVGIAGKFSIINRNTFRGAESFKFSFSGSYFNSSNGPGWEIGTDISLEVPRFVAPFGLHKLVPKRMSPRTLFSLGTSVQNNIGLDRQTFAAIVDYKWNFDKKKTIQLELMNAQYIRNLNIKDYFNVYRSELSKLLPIARTYFNNPTYNLPFDQAPNFTELVFNDPAFLASNPDEYRTNANVFNRYKILTSNFLIPTIAYSFAYNSQENFKDNNFSFFKIRVANSGNIASLISSSKNADGKKTLFNIPIAQYFKLDIEYKKFWELNENSVLGFRSFLGAVYPYGNSDIPFTKSYFAGGSNDIRAWKTYDLGPGSTGQGLEYNVGSLKFLTSLEYRFDILGSLKGALFMDAGNIWDITNSSFTFEEAKFKGLSSIKQIAIGSGLGARYDFSFLILRLDVGFKTYEPYLSGNKWFRNYNFGNAVYNIGINYPF